LRIASGLPGQRQRRLDEHAARHRVANLTDDFSQLEKLPAFAHLLDNVNTFVSEWKKSHKP